LKASLINVKQDMFVST